jgi:NAD(P)-dependent dehydrogenase (short-subunit alcohol dehydrogenase family)
MERVVVVGGTSGIGHAIAKESAAHGFDVVVASRDQARVDQVARELGVAGEVLDLTSEVSLRTGFAALGAIDHLVISGSSVQTGSLREQPLTTAKLSFESKFWGPYLAAKHAQLQPSGSLVLFSGILSRRPAVGLASLAALNAAVEGLGRALALELAPVRVNVISPGLIDTPAYARMPNEAREALFEATRARSPLARVGTPEDVAALTLAVIVNRYVTGTVIDIDGGALLTGVSPH